MEQATSSAERHDDGRSFEAHTAPQPDRLLKIVLAYMALSMVILWLPLNRALIEGAEYTWGLGAGIQGAGTGGFYWFLALLTALGFATLSLGWRGALGPFRWLLLAWMVLLVGQSAGAALSGSAGIEGVTFGVRLAVPWLAIAALDLGVLLLALAWVVRSRRVVGVPSRPRWGSRNALFGLAFLALLPIQVALLRIGEPQSALEQAGVIVTVLQWALVNSTLYPWHARPGL